MPNVSNTICYRENIFHLFSEYPRELDGEQRRRHELTGFNGIDGLAGDVYFLGQLGLRHAYNRPLDPQRIVQSLVLRFQFRLAWK